MHAIVMQYLFKFKGVNCSKSLLSHRYSTNRKIKKTSRNHYDVLKITPHATQNEVKSAYYKLTLQYHPDKNKSEYAKQKFQDVSDAYEVLSDHQLRKNYDRSMMIRQQPAPNFEQSVPRYKNRTSMRTSTGRMYNFDKWTHEHYEKQLHDSYIRRKRYEHYKIIEEMSENGLSTYTKVALVFLTITMLAIISQNTVDVPVSETKKYIKDNRSDTN